VSSNENTGASAYGITDKDRRYLQILKNSVGYVKVDINKTHNLNTGNLGHMFCHVVNNLILRDIYFHFQRRPTRQEVYQILANY
jgi:hypothetical protein